MRGLVDRKGELFAYLQNDLLYTLDGELTGRLEGKHIVDTAGNRMWRVIGDGVYSLDGMESIGFFSAKVPQEHYN